MPRDPLDLFLLVVATLSFVGMLYFALASYLAAFGAS